MKARLIPLYFEPGRSEGFDRQVEALKALLADRAEILAPVALGSSLPQADAVVFPQLLGEAYRRLADFKKLHLPILIVTSEFGTLSMWDWEIIDYLRSEGVATIAPYTLAQTRNICSALAAKRELREAKFLVFQDNPGQGAQAGIFKRFYWWEPECTARMALKFGVTIARESFQELAQEAKGVSDRQAQDAWKDWHASTEGLTDRSLHSALRLYVALKRRIDADPSIRAVGINCLNESHFCDSTPCLAFVMLFEQRGIVWGCEADTVSMLTEYVLGRSLGVPMMLTNLYPFVLGDAALRHERIEKFHDVSTYGGDPADYLLVAHCGYMGLMPPTFATRWTLRPKVLAIVDPNAVAVDALFSAAGPVTLAKLHAGMDRLTVAGGELKGYAQYPGSDCRNGGVIRIGDGHRLMSSLASHHYLLLSGHHRADIENFGKVFDLGIQWI